MTTLTARVGLLLLALAAAAPLSAQAAPTLVTLDTLARRFWHAAITGDTAALRQLTTDPQPRGATWAFTGGRGWTARMRADSLRVLSEPATRAQADTVWRTYSVKDGHWGSWHPHVLRFERRCGKWHVALLTIPGRS